jgi:putative ABC transport system permease protein
VVIPLGVYQKMYGARQSLSLMIKPRDPSLASLAQDEARVALRIDRGLKPAEPDNFGIVASGAMMALFQQATAGIAVVLVGIVGLSLLVGGIVIMNIMLMVVSERTREIGLRKALGAKRRDIMSQVLTESITLSVVGGIIGIALGALFSTIISSLTPVPSAVEVWSVALGVAITAAVGLFFGWVPARRAAMLDPIEALRRE